MMSQLRCFYEFCNIFFYKDIATMLQERMLRSSKIFVEKLDWKNEATSWRYLFKNYLVCRLQYFNSF